MDMVPSEEEGAAGATSQRAARNSNVLARLLREIDLRQGFAPSPLPTRGRWISNDFAPAPWPEVLEERRRLREIYWAEAICSAVAFYDANGGIGSGGGERDSGVSRAGFVGGAPTNTMLDPGACCVTEMVGSSVGGAKNYHTYREEIHSASASLDAYSGIESGRGGRGDDVSRAGSVGEAPVVTVLHPRARPVTEMVGSEDGGAQTWDAGSSADEFRNPGQPRGRIGYQADPVADAGGGRFLRIDVDAGGREQEMPPRAAVLQDDRSGFYQATLQSLLGGIVPLCLSTLQEIGKAGDFPYPIKLIAFGGLALVTAFTLAGLMCKKRAKAAVRVAASASIAAITVAAVAQVAEEEDYSKLVIGLIGTSLVFATIFI